MSTVHRATDFRLFEREARTLYAAGYAVSVLAPHERSETLGAFPSQGLDGIPVEPIPTSKSRAKGFLSSAFLLPKVARKRARLYHIHDPELLPLGLLLRVIRRKVIYDVREDFPKDIMGKSYIPPWVRPWLARVFSPLERFAAMCMNAVVATTEPIGRRFPGCTVVHNYPIRCDMPVPSGPPEGRSETPPFVVYFGAIARVLGAQEMAKGVALANRRARVRLLLAGPFEDERLRAELLRGPLSSCVEYRGVIPPRSVYRHYRGALAGLVLYHPYPNHIEAMPTKLFECMACGVPLIVSDFPLWRRIVRDQGCGLVVDPLNVSQIADAIIHLVNHPAKAAEMGERGRQLVQKKYNWESERKKLLLVYERLLGT